MQFPIPTGEWGTILTTAWVRDRRPGLDGLTALARLALPDGNRGLSQAQAVRLKLASEIASVSAVSAVSHDRSGGRSSMRIALPLNSSRVRDPTRPGSLAPFGHL